MVGNRTLVLIIVASVVGGAIVGVFSTLATILFLQTSVVQAPPFRKLALPVVFEQAPGVNFQSHNVSSALRDFPGDFPGEKAQPVDEVAHAVNEGDEPIVSSISPDVGTRPVPLLNIEIANVGTELPDGETDMQTRKGRNPPTTQHAAQQSHGIDLGSSSWERPIPYPACNKSWANDPLAVQRLIPDRLGDLITLKNSCFERTGGDKHAIFLWSHRRTGTHATISLILENFHNVEIIKTGHYLADASFLGGCTRLRLWQTLGHHLYVVRDPLDCMVSLSAYRDRIAFPNLPHNRKKPKRKSKGTMFWEVNAYAPIVSPNIDGGYVSSLNRLQFWKYHIVSVAAQPNVAFLSFENITENPEYAVATLETLFGWKRKTVGKEISKPKPADGTVFYRGGESDAGEVFEPKAIADAWKVLQQPVKHDHLLQCNKSSPVELRSSVREELRRIVRSAAEIDGFPEHKFRFRPGDKG